MPSDLATSSKINNRLTTLKWGVVVASGRAIQGRKAILGGDKQMFGAE
jgi:hypothetical protein